MVLNRSIWTSVFLAFALLAFSPNQYARSATIQLLHSEVEAFSLRLDLIERAQSSIDISYYEISDDDTSGQLLAALLRAVNRGVSIRIMSDAHVGSNVMPKALMQYLIENQIPVRERPVDVRYQLELGRQRLHDKLFIVDRAHLITGGRNLEQEFFGVGNRKYVDRDVYITGKVTCEAADYFNQRWNDPVTAQPSLHRAESPKVAKRQKHPEWNYMERNQAMEQVRTWLANTSSAPLAAANLCGSDISFPATEVNDCNTRFLHDFVGRPKNESGAIAPEMLRLIQRSRTSIDIETPYFAISNELKSILIDATRRGVRVRVLTNSLESVDQIAEHAGYVNERRWMLRAGIELFELQGRNILHAKSLVVDGRTTMVGSYNWDMLSERRNSEVAIIVTDCSVASQVSQSMAAHRAQSKQLHRGELFRYDAKESNASEELQRQLRRLRVVAPTIKRYL